MVTKVSILLILQMSSISQDWLQWNQNNFLKGSMSLLLSDNWGYIYIYIALVNPVIYLCTTRHILHI